MLTVEAPVQRSPPAPAQRSRVLASDLLDSIRAGGIGALAKNRIVGVSVGLGCGLEPTLIDFSDSAAFDSRTRSSRLTSSGAMDEPTPTPASASVKGVHGTVAGPGLDVAPTCSLPERTDVKFRLPSKRGQALHAPSGAPVKHG